MRDDRCLQFSTQWEHARENKRDPIQDSFMGYEQAEQKGQILCPFALSVRYGGMKTSR